MSEDPARPLTSPLLTDEVRRFLGSIGGGYRLLSRKQKSRITKRNAKGVWETRRARYGPTGQRQKPYAAWRAAHGYPPLGPDGRPVTEP